MGEFLLCFLRGLRIDDLISHTKRPLYVCDLVSLFVSPIEPRDRQPHEDYEYDETPQEKKLRLAKLYLDQLKEQGERLLSKRHD